MILAIEIALLIIIVETIICIVKTIKTINIMDFKDIAIRCRTPQKLSLKRNKKK